MTYSLVSSESFLHSPFKRAQEASNYQVPEWARVQDHAIDKLASEYAANYDEDTDEFVCVACNKSFKSEKQ